MISLMYICETKHEIKYYFAIDDSNCVQLLLESSVASSVLFFVPMSPTHVKCINQHISSIIKYNFVSYYFISVYHMYSNDTTIIYIACTGTKK